MRASVSYAGEPGEWLVRSCSAGLAVSPPAIETMDDVKRFLEDLQNYENSIKAGVPAS